MGRFLPPVQVLPINDAYQGHIKNIDFELWHFEAICDNEYSVLLGVMIYRLKKSGIVKTRLGIYKNGVANVVSNKTYLLSNVALSNEFLSIKMNDKLRIIFDQEHYNKTGEWMINISIKEHDFTVDLKFIGTTTGWKTKTNYTSWAAILPKAAVIGSMTLKGQQIALKGKGYHDHNWEQSFTILQKKHGWFCGTIYADSLKITWAKEINNQAGGQVVIINQDTNKSNKKRGFYNIPTENVTFTMTDTILKNGHRTPTEIKLKIKETTVEDNISVSAELLMKICDVQEIRFFTTRYYVCLVKITGTLKLNTTEEHLQNSSQVIEFPNYLVDKHRTEL
jgi:hypothetical protein